MCDWSELCVYLENHIKYTAFIIGLTVPLRSKWLKLLENTAIFTSVLAKLLKIVRNFVEGDSMSFMHEGDSMETQVALRGFAS